MRREKKKVKTEWIFPDFPYMSGSFCLRPTWFKLESRQSSNLISQKEITRGIFDSVPHAFSCLFYRCVSPFVCSVFPAFSRFIILSFIYRRLFTSFSSVSALGLILSVVHSPISCEKVEYIESLVNYTEILDNILAWIVGNVQPDTCGSRERDTRESETSEISAHLAAWRAGDGANIKLFSKYIVHGAR